MSQSSVITDLRCELVSPEDTPEGKNIYHLAATRLQPLPIVSLGETQDLKTGYWPWIAEVYIKEMISVSPNTCIFPYIEKC